MNIIKQREALQAQIDTEQTILVRTTWPPDVDRIQAKLARLRQRRDAIDLELNANSCEGDDCIYCGQPTDGRLVCSDECQREHFGM